MRREKFLQRCVILVIAILGTESIASAGVLGLIRDEPPEVHALLIGIGSYGNDRSLNLMYPARDVELISRSLTSDSSLTSQANVIVIKNEHATRENILNAIDQAVHRIGSSRNVLMIYWSGHSVYDRLTNDLALLTHNSQVSESTLPNDSVSLVKDIIPRFSPDQNMIFVGDGCSLGDALVGKISTEYPNISVISSTKFDENAMDGDRELDSSPFAYYFAQALRGPTPDLDENGLLSVEEAYSRNARHLLRRCARCGEQRPVLDEIPADAVCAKCGTDLHSCSNCIHFDTSVRWECRKHEEVPARIVKKSTRNECPLFTPKAAQEFARESDKGNPGSSPDDARSAFDALFKL